MISSISTTPPHLKRKYTSYIPSGRKAVSLTRASLISGLGPRPHTLKIFNVLLALGLTLNRTSRPYSFNVTASIGALLLGDLRGSSPYFNYPGCLNRRSATNRRVNPYFGVHVRLRFLHPAHTGDRTRVLPTTCVFIRLRLISKLL